MADLRRVSLGYEQLTGIGSAKALASIPAGATHTVFQADGQDIRWRDDGTDPTASVGFVLKNGVFVEWTGSLANMKFIQTSATATLSAWYYRIVG